MSPGDVVATFCDELGEWTAAQIIALDPRERTVDVLDLDWSGPEPSSVADLTAVEPLRGIGSACSREWVLPRSHKIIGNASPLRSRPSGSFQPGWSTGHALHEHRMRSRDPHWDLTRLYTSLAETRLHLLLADPDFVDEDSIHLVLKPGPVTGPIVDCQRLVSAFPNLVTLTVWGVMGRLQDASALNQLAALRSLELDEVFGMTAADCLDPVVMTRLESVVMRNVPTEYAAAMRRAWTPEVPKGVYLSVSGARKPEWVAQNSSIPLRGWGVREGISSGVYRKARAAWFQTTSPLLVALAADLSEEVRQQRLRELGRAFAQAFDQVNARSSFIETEERDELLDGLANLVSAAPTASGVDRHAATDIILHAVNQARSW
jgi:hypothetical protein